MSLSSCSSFKRKSEFDDLSALLVTVLFGGGGGTFNDPSVKVAPLKSTGSLALVKNDLNQITAGGDVSSSR